MSSVQKPYKMDGEYQNISVFMLQMMDFLAYE